MGIGWINGNIDQNAYLSQNTVMRTKPTGAGAVDAGKSIDEGAAGNSFAASYAEVMEQLRDHMQQMREDIKNGDTEKTFQIGNESFTVKEWNRMLADFDRAEEELKEEVEEAREAAEEKQMEEQLETD